MDIESIVFLHFFGNFEMIQKCEKRPFFRLFEMQFTLFQILHFVNPLNSSTNTGSLVLQDNEFINKDALMTAMKSIVSAGAYFGLKATSVFVPGANLLGEAASSAEKIINSLFDAKEKEDKNGSSGI